MPQQVRMWEITPENTLAEVTPSGINLEERLEDWLESDISMLDPDLLVIGRQVRTPFSGIIDLLCLDSAGDTVIVELKKGKTPREVTAQALDYAAWVKDLSLERIKEIAAGYSKLGSSLEDAFASRFDQQLPDTLNLNHRSLIVAEQMDASTERIVRYLSDLNVPVNIATVQHFKDSNGREMLAQVFLVEPEVAAGKERETSKSSRPTVGQLQSMAEASGIGELYLKVKNGVSGILSPQQPANQSVGYTWKRKDGSSRAVLKTDAVPPDENGGLKFYIHATRLVDYLGITLGELKSLLPESIDDYAVSGWIVPFKDEGDNPIGWQGTFRTVEEVDKFIAGLRAIVGQ